MAQLRQDQRLFQQSNVTIVVVGPEDAGAFASFWQAKDLPFIGLPDPKHSVLKLYGQQVKLFRFGRMPAQVLVDRQGTVRSVHYGHSMSDIPTTEEVLGMVGALGLAPDDPAGTGT